MLALALKLLAGGWAVELRATVSVDASGSGNWGRGACIGPRCPGEEVARTWKRWDCCLWVPGHHAPLPVHGLSVGSPSPCWEPVLGSLCMGRWEQRPPTGQSPLGRGLEEMGLSGCPGLLDGGGGPGGTA